MNRIESAISELHKMNDSAVKDGLLNSVHPLPKLLITVIYIAFVVSLGKYEVVKAIFFAVYPAAAFIAGRLSLKLCLKRIWMILPIVCLIGVFDPFMDRSEIEIFNLSVNGGIISMSVLILKGILAVLASYILVITTSIDKICAALRMLRMPKIMVTQIMLMYRHIMLFLKEALRVSNAYRLRAPGHRGIHVSAWGSLLGQMLLRSMDRADEVYESMLLRGFNIDAALAAEKRNPGLRDIVFLAACILVFAVLKFMVRI